MGWRPQVLFQAFGKAGMLASAVYRPGTVSETTFACGFEQPDALLLGDQHQSTEYEIEYETATSPRIRQGDALLVIWQGVTTQYTARAHARPVGDGHFSRCTLTKA